MDYVRLVCDAVAAFWKLRLFIEIITIFHTGVPPQRLNVNSLLTVLFKDVMQKRERKEIQKITLAKEKIAAVPTGRPIPPPPPPPSIILPLLLSCGAKKRGVPIKAKASGNGGGGRREFDLFFSSSFSPFLSASAATDPQGEEKKAKVADKVAQSSSFDPLSPTEKSQSLLPFFGPFLGRRLPLQNRKGG